MSAALERISETLAGYAERRGYVARWGDESLDWDEALAPDGALPAFIEQARRLALMTGDASSFASVRFLEDEEGLLGVKAEGNPETLADALLMTLHLRLVLDWLADASGVVPIEDLARLSRDASGVVFDVLAGGARRREETDGDGTDSRI